MTLDRPGAMQVAMCDPSLGHQRMPINLALAAALERIGFLRQLLAVELESSEDDDTPKPNGPEQRAA